jgi:hypothetical protein
MPLGICLPQRLSVNTVPGAVQTEPVMTLPGGLPRAELGGKIPPGGTGAEPPHNRFDHPAVILKSTPTLGRSPRHQRFDPGPLFAAENAIT